MKIWQAVALLMIAIGLGAAQDRLAETLRKGVVEEEKNQNLNAAIQAYQSILSQFDQDRPTAATALFRLAECYRKQGKSDQAIAAYKRVASEFQDQTRLAEQSRTVLAQTLKVPPARTADAVATLQEAYRRRVKELMEKQVAIMKEKVAYAVKQYELGASDEVAVADAKNQLLQAQRRLAEVDFGPAGPSTAEARGYRALLEAQVQMVQTVVARAQREYERGALTQLDLKDAQLKLLQAQQDLAAFEAGILQPSTAPPQR